MRNQSSQRDKVFRAAVLSAWEEMKLEGTRYEIGDMERGDEGPSELRARLPEEFRAVSLRQVRDACAYHNKGARLARHKPRKSPVAERIRRAAIANWVPSEDHSQEYSEYINSPEWQKRKREHKVLCGFRCQLCSRFRLGDELDVHHVHYDSLSRESTQDLMCVCVDGCHQVCDVFREAGVRRELSEISSEPLLP